ncbi:hypothetical protein Rsub_02623 [Raphidocelis subcapitata]|uniref:Cyanobacterial aminoacyl-tRNA synthetase CAAD domain-containing protein n=1 Tax=Raphidocelis subcapitata TaxID=307507 RepID=A0A2V0NRH3_9CHLO|nr:hypothetical protein Rsub_02623 [Raphidocelis subcapitata]|eukprot:GBF89919.1 hypothetical protein Rsub_02623 [Raphidocelis subcapitata]
MGASLRPLGIGARCPSALPRGLRRAGRPCSAARAARWRTPPAGDDPASAAKRAEQAAQQRREVGARDIDMTGGVGDYYMSIPEDEQPVGVRAIRGAAAALRDKWNGTTNKAEVFLFTGLVSLGIWGAVALAEVLDEIPFVREYLQFIGFLVSGWAFWRYFLLEGGTRDLAEELREAKSSVAAATTAATMRAREAAQPPAGGAKGGQRRGGDGK